MMRPCSTMSTSSTTSTPSLVTNITRKPCTTCLSLWGMMDTRERLRKPLGYIKPHNFWWLQRKPLSKSLDPTLENVTMDLNRPFFEIHERFQKKSQAQVWERSIFVERSRALLTLLQTILRLRWKCLRTSKTVLFGRQNNRRGHIHDRRHDGFHIVMQTNHAVFQGGKHCETDSS